MYGTEGFDPGDSMVVPFSDRGSIKNVIGEEAEKLVFTFCVVDRKSFDDLLLSYYDSDTGKKKKRKSFVMRSRVSIKRTL